ncbi:alpha-N-arabinofuranosidase [Aestuariicella hydrocarbonica]|uniref:non-reducing end alpha-L-arabinofuranosidase n=2 Tax=Pseudomaricurvus hydrocarbonicus TaxID=1470433 RepID=A0A9E5JWJ0_9GAMM|nr:alpha-N-arabinofuranosidase [Aestuariicella hydrocarbonica]
MLISGAMLATPSLAEQNSSIRLNPSQPGHTINRDIFGQFAEHIGEGIYGGIWVGEDSKIPNVKGIRADVVKALRAIKVPVVRWPGGCYADQYHWREGVGPQSSRVDRINPWGNVIEPNHFGTDEFMEFVQQIGSEAYINLNLGSGTVQEAADWLEYMTTDLPTTLAKQRAANGHTAPYRVKYIGFGNEAWGCGGAMTADEYFARLKAYSVFALNHNPQQRFAGIDLLFDRDAHNPHAMQRIAAGPNDTDTAFTEALMKKWAAAPGYLPLFDAMSLHHYTMTRGPMSDASQDFDESDYATFAQLALNMDRVITLHTEIMDTYDPQKKVALVVDEWGNWLKPDIAENPKFLKQQNSLRDAITASLTLNVFARHADRVRMSNIAQMVNVIQSMILTDGEKMLLTPTYHIYHMYVPFQDATLIPISIDSGRYRMDDINLPQIDAIAARDANGKLWLALTNIDPVDSADITLQLEGMVVKSAKGEVLTAPRVDTVNRFDEPAAVVPKPVKFTAKNSRLLLSLPPKSVTVVELKG